MVCCHWKPPGPKRPRRVASTRDPGAHLSYLPVVAWAGLCLGGYHVDLVYDSAYFEDVVA
jgi:hypothetical protein